MQAIQLFIPYLDKSKIEQIFVDIKEKELDDAFLGVYAADPNDKVRRKRVLISSDFRTALRKKYIYDVFVELN